MKDKAKAIFWFRRDLRLEDNTALYHALEQNQEVIPIFIFDTEITDKLPKNDARVHFIYEAVQSMQNQLQQKNRGLRIFKGKPLDVFKKILDKENINAVYLNRDHEPYGIERDKEIEAYLKTKNIELLSYLDHLLFQKDEIVKADNTPYQVFTPYSKKCKSILQERHFAAFPSEKSVNSFTIEDGQGFPSLKDLGFVPSNIAFPDNKINKDKIGSYHNTRNFPGENGTSRLGIHLRFGSMSIRKLAKLAHQENETYFNELLWREFYAMILWQYPQIVKNSFKPAYDKIEWINDEGAFEKWKAGKTGYPMVDAGMRELAATGYMHNRVRMITASFLCKHLLIDWRWGEAWFAEKLLDYELSSNNGGWQWSAGTGCDAAPYFRIFNPTEQQKKFDKKGMYIKKWIKEWDSAEYPHPMVNHKEARERCLKTYKGALV